MNAPHDTTETPFWRFSLDFYRHAGVSEACIALQDEFGVDVNLLLFLLWLASDDRKLSTEEVQMLDDNVRDWRNLTIVPVRNTRRNLKGAATLVAPAKQEAFRTKVKAIELDAERLQQEALYEFTKSGPLGEPAAAGIAARANIAAYERVLDIDFPKSATSLLIGAFEATVH